MNGHITVMQLTQKPIQRLAGSQACAVSDVAGQLPETGEVRGRPHRNACTGEDNEPIVTQRFKNAIVKHDGAKLSHTGGFLDAKTQLTPSEKVAVQFT
jgi:hypothetical protein